MFHGLILVVHLIACLVLIAVILLQAGRGGGLADTFGSGAAQSIFGTRGTAFLTRATTACAAIFMLTSLTLAILSVQQGRSLIRPSLIPTAAKISAQKQPARKPAEPAAKPAEPKTEPAPQPPATQPTENNPAAKDTQTTEQKTGDQK